MTDMDRLFSEKMANVIKRTNEALDLIIEAQSKATVSYIKGSENAIDELFSGVSLAVDILERITGEEYKVICYIDNLKAAGYSKLCVVLPSNLMKLDITEWFDEFDEELQEEAFDIAELQMPEDDI